MEFDYCHLFKEPFHPLIWLWGTFVVPFDMMLVMLWLYLVSMLPSIGRWFGSNVVTDFLPNLICLFCEKILAFSSRFIDLPKKFVKILPRCLRLPYKPSRPLGCKMRREFEVG